MFDIKWKNTPKRVCDSGKLIASAYQRKSNNEEKRAHKASTTFYFSDFKYCLLNVGRNYFERRTITEMAKI